MKHPKPLPASRDVAGFFAKRRKYSPQQIPAKLSHKSAFACMTSCYRM
jgi:hypothetical protein